MDLERTTKHLQHSNEDLLSKLHKLEQQMKLTPKNVQEFDRINGNEVDHYLQTHKINEINVIPEDLKGRVDTLDEQQRANTDTLFNLTGQLANFDKLHLSMLELLENVENIETRINKNFPEVRKEISKLEAQMSDALSKYSTLKEDQSNTKVSVKAISVSVSNLKDKVNNDHRKLYEMEGDVDILKTSSNLQTSKLHDHILKVSE